MKLLKETLIILKITYLMLMQIFINGLVVSEKDKPAISKRYFRFIQQGDVGIYKKMT